jgi:hypothetical protein
MRDAVERVFDNLGLVRTADLGSKGAVVTVSLTEDPFLLPPQATPRLYIEGKPVVWGNALSYIVKGEGKAWAEVHPVRREIDLFVPSCSEDWIDCAASHLWFPLTSSLTVLLHVERRYLLHAACLLPDAENDSAILFVGESDRGKSTLAYSLVRQGWRYLSDDAVLLRDDGEAVSAIPYRRSFGLDAVAKEYFPELRSHGPTQLAELDKLCVDAEVYHGGQRAEYAVPKVLVAPAIVDAATSRLEPLSQKEALHTVLRQSGLLTLDPQRTPMHFDSVVRLCAQARLFRLEAGRDVLELPANVARLLRSAWRG